MLGDSGKSKARRKALSTVFQDLDTATEMPKKNLKNLDSMNTIIELSNDEYSRGGYSSKKQTHEKSPL